jgi:hypothetical protein
MKILKLCFKIGFLTKKFKENNQCDIPKTFSKMQWLETSKYTIFLTWLEIQNLWNLINVLIKKYENMYLNVSYDISKFDGSKKIKLWHS